MRKGKLSEDTEYTTLMKFQLACHVEGSDCSYATFICEWQFETETEIETETERAI